MLDRIASYTATHSYQEVVVQDDYRLKALDFVPDVIYDIGANVGVFSAWARHVFPSAKIVALEPDSGNFDRLSATLSGCEGCVLIKGAIGQGEVWFAEGQGNLNHRFLSVGPGYTREAISGNADFTPSDVPVVSIADLLETHGGTRTLVKIDAEGAEGCLCNDARSTAALQTADWVTIEFHPWAASANLIHDAMRVRLEWLAAFWRTHRVELKTWPTGGMARMRKEK